MDEAVRRTLLDLNRIFYASTADEFSATRQQPWPGFDGILPYIPPGVKGQPLRVLDVGCGNGRFASYLADQNLAVDYTGVDASPALLDLARSQTGELSGEAQPICRQIWLTRTGLMGLTTSVGLRPGVCFATFHHLPGYDLCASGC